MSRLRDQLPQSKRRRKCGVMMRFTAKKRGNKKSAQNCILQTIFFLIATRFLWWTQSGRQLCGD